MESRCHILEYFVKFILIGIKWWLKSFIFSFIKEISFSWCGIYKKPKILEFSLLNIFYFKTTNGSPLFLSPAWRSVQLRIFVKHPPALSINLINHLNTLNKHKPQDKVKSFKGLVFRDLVACLAVWRSLWGWGRGRGRRCGLLTILLRNQDTVISTSSSEDKSMVIKCVKELYHYYSSGSISTLKASFNNVKSEMHRPTCYQCLWYGVILKL